MAHLLIVRPLNLLLIALIQIFIKYGLFHPFQIDITLNGLGFGILVVATVCIAAGGYIINDVYDVEIDRINAPDKVLIGNRISESAAHRYYIVLNVIGVGLGFYLSNTIGKPGFAAMFIIFSALLYIYASYLKSMLLVGNIIVSFLVAMSLIIVGLFDLLPVINPQNQGIQSTIFSIVLDYAIFAFFLNLIREIVKDLQDINGDKNGGKNTLPIAIGRKRATKVVFALGVLAVIAVIGYVYTYLYHKKLIVLYFLFALVGPLLLFCVKAWSADSGKDYGRLSGLLKLIMFLGMCSILLFQFALL